MGFLLDFLSRKNVNLSIIIIAFGIALILMLNTKNENSKHKIRVDNREITVEFAITESEQKNGLSDRTSLDKIDGMLFIYNEPRRLKFWMHRTEIPLTILYFNSAGALVTAYDMLPEPGVSDSKLHTYDSLHPAKFALEISPDHPLAKNLRITHMPIKLDVGQF